jgi:hypothetical protein
MFGANSCSQRYSSNNKLSIDQGRSNLIHNNQNISNNNNTSAEFYLLYQTPIKQFEQVINNQNNNNTTPFHFDFNQHFGNLWSAGQIPNNQLWNQNINLSPSQLKKSLEKSYKLTPISISAKLKNISSQNNSDNSNSNSNSNNSGSNFNNNLILNPINEGRENILKLNGVYDGNNSLNNVNNNNDPSKKNLYELFNNAKNDLFLSDTKKQINNINNNINLPNNSINNRIDLIKKKNVNLQISPQFMFSSPRNIKKSKKIFECSGSTNNSSNKIIYKKRRFRKNNDQLSLLKKFYEENKTWSKSQIKEISLKISLKENKVYKWLWDQKNKEIKANKFVVKKGDNE